MVRAATAPGGGGEDISNGNTEAGRLDRKPIVSVLLRADRRPDLLRLTLESVLNQTYPAIEALILGESGTGLDSWPSPYVRLLAPERGWAELCGHYVAVVEAGDILHPLRLARQVAALEASPAAPLAGCGAWRFDGSALRPDALNLEGQPGDLGWLLHLAEPAALSSILARTEPARAAGAAAGWLGAVLRLLSPMEVAPPVYVPARLHVSRAPVRDAAPSLAAAYEALLGDEAGHAATLIARHVAIGDVPRPGQREALMAAIGNLATAYGRQRSLPQPRLTALAARALPRAATVRRPPSRPPVSFQGTPYHPSPIEIDRPPTLFVVVDTEAEFDWSGPFSRALTAVSAMGAVERGQAILDGFGLRPVYLVDYPVASQAAGYRPLATILARGGCEIGAHLHPWTNPPFEEEPSQRNSFAGNLDPALAERKLTMLLTQIEAAFGIRPRFYKAGRYGIGPGTLAMLARAGIAVDFSLLPGADLSRVGGPDFRSLRAVPYSAGEPPILSLPMTRGHIGPLARLGPALAPILDHAAARRWRLRGLLSGARLLDQVTLTPEGVPAWQQEALIRTLVQQGRRFFVLHYHSPSLVPGHTPYARTPAEVDALLERLRRVCAFILERLGAVPGNPLDLLPPELRRQATSQPARRSGSAATAA